MNLERGGYFALCPDREYFTIYVGNKKMKR